MSHKHTNTEAYELVPRDSTDLDDAFDLDHEAVESHPFFIPATRIEPSRFLLRTLKNLLPKRIRRRTHPFGVPLRQTRSPGSGFRGCLRRPSIQRLIITSYIILAVITSLLVIFGLFNPSYTVLPSHYQELRNRAQRSSEPGRGNPRQEKVFIAASLYDPDGQLARGAWGRNVHDLVQLLGPDNVYLSIYENDAGPEASTALHEFAEKTTCNHTIVFEEHLDLAAISHVTMPDGTEHVKRIAYLAEVRNRALRPMETSNVKWDKLLYLNDVVFDPIDAAQLLFSTNVNQTGHTDYRAACAVDFIMPFKFYDTFATRDLEGYSMGTPFFPWFTVSGEAQSRQDILDGKDAVRVRSCWGGMVAFNARFFQPHSSYDEDMYTAADQMGRSSPSGFRFRAEEDLYWDASECCLIHADIQRPESDNTGIYLNPYVRVAYDSDTLSWLPFTQRFERLYPPIHFIADIVSAMPHYNPRRAEQPWEEVKQRVWVPDESLPAGGSFQTLTRFASHSGFCGRRALQVIKESHAPGEKNWGLVPVPS